jgi:hypothetical protein
MEVSCCHPRLRPATGESRLRGPAGYLCPSGQDAKSLPSPGPKAAFRVPSSALAGRVWAHVRTSIGGTTGSVAPQSPLSMWNGAPRAVRRYRYSGSGSTHSVRLLDEGAVAVTPVGHGALFRDAWGRASDSLRRGVRVRLGLPGALSRSGPPWPTGAAVRSAQISRLPPAALARPVPVPFPVAMIPPGDRPACPRHPPRNNIDLLIGR